MLDEHQKRFIKLTEELSYSRSNVLEHFCELAAISLANAIPIHDAEWEKREARYMAIVKQYKPDEVKKFPEMLGCVTNSLCNGDDFNFHDCLGELLMTDEITGRSKWDSDVCFTPKEVSRCMAGISLTGLTIPEKGYITMCEPACGGGSLVIQACAEMKELGFNFQTQLHVTAIELRSMIAHMAYIQFSLLHIPAVVLHGNSLSLEVWSEWKTPAHVLGLWDYKLRRDRKLPEADPAKSPGINEVAIPLPLITKGQAVFDFQLREEQSESADSTSLRPVASVHAKDVDKAKPPRRISANLRKGAKACRK